MSGTLAVHQTNGYGISFIKTPESHVNLASKVVYIHYESISHRQMYKPSSSIQEAHLTMQKIRLLSAFYVFIFLKGV